MMRVKFNAAQLEASIQNLAERAAKGASEEMRRAAIKIRNLARDYAPVKTGLLERSIDYMTVKGSDRRNVFVIYIDLDEVDPKGKAVGDYAWIMEEELHPFGRQKGERRYTLGKGSLAKAAGGKKVGGRFLARATREGSKDLLAKMNGAVARSLSSARFADIRYQREQDDEE